jgi:hypothetical protein
MYKVRGNIRITDLLSSGLGMAPGNGHPPQARFPPVPRENFLL